MASLTQGDPLPDITQTTTKTTTAPDYYTNYLSNLSAAGNAALYQPGTIDPKTGIGTLKTGDQLVAGYDPLQTAGYGQFESAAGAYKPGLTQAQQYLGQGANVDQADINAFMNPYTQNVVNEMGRLSQQNIQRNVMPSLIGGAVGTGDLGSRRYAGALGQSMADIQKNLTGQQYGALSKGYEGALEAAFKQAGLEQTAADKQATMAKMEQELGLRGAEALTKAGAERQAYEQSKIDAPLKNASNVSALLRGYQIPLNTTETFKGPKAGLYKTSTLADILGVLTAMGSLKAGSPAEKALSKLFNIGSLTSGKNSDTAEGWNNWWNSLSAQDKQDIADIDTSS